MQSVFFLAKYKLLSASRYAHCIEIVSEVTVIVQDIDMCSAHGLRTSRGSFFSEIRNFWAWADKLG